MWEKNNYKKNGKIVGKIYKRSDRLFTYGYHARGKFVGGLAETEEKAKKAVENISE